MDFKQLTYIIVIAEELNLTKAAERLYVSQSTLSLFLSKLEHELGITLFRRVKNRLVITPEGQLYVETARQILALKQDLYQKLQIPKQQRLSINIGISCQTLFELMGRIYTQFQSAYPNIQLSVTEGRAMHILEKMKTGRLDLAVTGGAEPIENPLFKSELLMKDELILVLSPQHRLAHLASSDFLHLPTADIALFSGDSFALSGRETVEYHLSQEMFRDYNISPRIICELNNRYNICQMALENTCVALLPFYGVPRNMNLLACRPERPYYRYLQVFQKKSRINSREINALKNMLTEAYLHYYD